IAKLRVALYPRRQKIQIDDQDMKTIAGERHGDIDHGHRPSDAAFIGIKANNCTLAIHQFVDVFIEVTALLFDIAARSLQVQHLRFAGASREKASEHSAALAANSLVQS